MQRRFVLGRGEIRLVLPYVEFKGSRNIQSVFMDLSEKIKMTSLTPEKLRKICRFDSGLQRKEAFQMLEDAAIVLSKLGADGCQIILAVRLLFFVNFEENNVA